MNITNVTVTKVAEESTENADYQLEYSIVNDALTRVHASIQQEGYGWLGERSADRYHLHGTRRYFMQHSYGRAACTPVS